MQVLSDFPPHVLDQIIGNPSTSYTVIRLWLCGDKKFNDKLSNGLTLLNLKSHPISSCILPQMISQLTSLRHLSLFSQTHMLKTVGTWPSFMRSLPNTLESLSIRGDPTFAYCFWNWDENINHTRGASLCIELEKLFPRLHTLTLTSSKSHQELPMSAELFPALPSSLTRLEAVFKLSYDFNTTSYLSKLPPNLRDLVGPIIWNRDESLSEDEFFEMIRRDFSEAPASLETMPIWPSQSWAASQELQSSRFKCPLPKSLLEVDFSSSKHAWAPSLASRLPPNLHTLTLGNINLNAFDETDWVEAIPQTVTKLVISPDKAKCSNDLVSLADLLPPNLKTLMLCPKLPYSTGLFGNWELESSPCNFWPSTLSTLVLKEVWMEPSAIPHLPDTLEQLTISICTQTDAPWATLDTSTLPPKLTALDLEWTPGILIVVSLAKFKLKTCTMTFRAEGLCEQFGTDRLSDLPSSLTELYLKNVNFGSSKSTGEISPLPNLMRLEVHSIHCTWFDRLPRSLQFFVTNYIGGLSKSPLMDEGHLFKDLPPLLREFLALGMSTDLPRGFELPPQQLDHLPYLHSLCFNCTSKVSPKMLRNLPRTLLNLKLNIEDWNEDDLPYLPPHLESLYTPNMTPELVKRMSLRSLCQLGAQEYSQDVAKIAHDRVQQAAVSQ